MNLRHFYPDVSKLQPAFRQRVLDAEQAGTVTYLPWLNSGMILQGIKPYGPPYTLRTGNEIRGWMEERRFINDDGLPQTDMGYLDLESPSAFWRPDIGAYQQFSWEEHCRVYQQARAVAQSIAPRVKLGFYAATEGPSNWGMQEPPFPADRLTVIHAMSSAVFVSAYMHDNSPDEQERYAKSAGGALQAVHWHSGVRYDTIAQPLVAFVWAKWRPGGAGRRELMPLDLWRRWLRDLRGQADALCWFGDTSDANVPYWDAFTAAG